MLPLCHGFLAVVSMKLNINVDQILAFFLALCRLPVSCFSSCASCGHSSVTLWRSIARPYSKPLLTATTRSCHRPPTTSGCSDSFRMRCDLFRVSCVTLKLYMQPQRRKRSYFVPIRGGGRLSRIKCFWRRMGGQYLWAGEGSGAGDTRSRYGRISPAGPTMRFSTNIPGAIDWSLCATQARGCNEVCHSVHPLNSFVLPSQEALTGGYALHSVYMWHITNPSEIMDQGFKVRELMAF